MSSSTYNIECNLLDCLETMTTTNSADGKTMMYVVRLSLTTYVNSMFSAFRTICGAAAAAMEHTQKMERFKLISSIIVRYDIHKKKMKKEN